MNGKQCTYLFRLRTNKFRYPLYMLSGTSAIYLE